MFWPVEEEDWMSFTPGTWTTEELGEENMFIPAFLSLPKDPAMALLPALSLLVCGPGSLQVSILSFLLPQDLSPLSFPSPNIVPPPRSL